MSPRLKCSAWDFSAGFLFPYVWPTNDKIVMRTLFISFFFKRNSHYDRARCPVASQSLQAVRDSPTQLTSWQNPESSTLISPTQNCDFYYLSFQDKKKKNQKLFYFRFGPLLPCKKPRWFLRMHNAASAFPFTYITHTHTAVQKTAEAL